MLSDIVCRSAGCKFNDNVHGECLKSVIVLDTPTIVTYPIEGMRGIPPQCFSYIPKEQEEKEDASKLPL